MRCLPFVTLIVLAACGDGSAPRRDWRASDHAQPAGSQSAGQAPAAAQARDDGQGRARAAAELFRIGCSPCHGEDGLGNGPAAAGMPVPSLASAAVRAMPDDALRAVITSGRGMMPAFGERYPPDAIAALAEHIRTLAR